MNPEDPGAKPEIERLIDAENANFEISRKGLGRTYELLADYQDAYDSLTRMVVMPDQGAVTDDAMVTTAGLHFMAVSRREFTIGVLALMRAYRGDSLLHLRRAIEASAFAARIRKHPHLARLWVESAAGKDQYDDYREKVTKKLFPPDNSLLLELGERYDRCSKQMHSSIYGMAGHFSYSDGPVQILLKFFDMPPDHSLVTALYYTLDTHRRILRLYAQVFRSNMDGTAAWDVRIISLETKLDSHREEWKKVVLRHQ